ncbi:MAG: hypothetical protein QF408_06485 [Pirellulales bacterium]|nr:hypothetical protein [Pirellulales bacterium]
MNRHVIQLRGPWTRTPIKTGILHKRCFHAPSGIEDGERVWITIDNKSGDNQTGDNQTGKAQVRCNGHLCGNFSGTGEFDITALLAPYNELEICVNGPDGPDRDQTRGTVCLEIRSP